MRRGGLGFLLDFARYDRSRFWRWFWGRFLLDRNWRWMRRRVLAQHSFQFCLPIKGRWRRGFGNRLRGRSVGCPGWLGRPGRGLRRASYWGMIGLLFGSVSVMLLFNPVRDRGKQNEREQTEHALPRIAIRQ